MAKKSNLGDLRVAIEDINREVMHEHGNGEVPNVMVLSRLKETRANLVTHFSSQLIDIALTKLLNDVCRRNAVCKSLNGQVDLFEGYRRIPKSITIERGLKKDTAKLKISEADEWLNSHSNRTVASDHQDFRRLVEECRKYSDSDDETIESALSRKRDAGVFTKELELAE